MDNNLQKYFAFLKTVELGSFTKSAEALNYAQSSISKMILDLETDWGIILLERSKNGVHLTSAGEQILPYIRSLMDDYRKLNDYVNELKGVQTGIIRIGTFSSVAINWLPNIFAKLQKDFPKIEYEMLLGDYNEIEKWINDGRVDCGFLSLPSSSNFDIISLKKDEYKVVLPPKHILTKQKTIAINALNEQPFLLLEHGGKTEVSVLLQQYNVQPKIQFTTWEDFAIMSMVEQGLGISILPEMILKRISYNIEIRSLEKPYFREIGLAVKDINKISPATKKFIKYLKFREQ